MIYIVTAVHNRYSVTEDFVDLLLNQTYGDIKLVLVDDGSTDGTAEMVKSKLPSTVILKGDGNLWWGGALHMAYKWFAKNSEISDDDYVMFSNDDVKFENDYIEKAISVLDEMDKTLLTGCGVSVQSGNQVDGAVHFSFPQVVGKIIESPRAVGNCASTRSLFFRVNDLRCIGGFHPVLLPHYGSDYEWTIRASKKGYTICCLNELQYGVNEETTGIKQLKISKIFTKRSVSNPFYKVTFVILAAPIGKKILSLLWQLGRLIIRVLQI